MKYVFYIIVVGILTLKGESLLAQKSSFVEGNLSDPKIKKGFRTFKMNRFSEHIVYYIKKTDSGDSLCDLFADKLIFINDTLLAKVCDTKYTGCSDSLISPGESFSFINNGYWQKIPLSRLSKIKSKRQPIAAITAGLVGISFITFMGCLTVALISKNETVQNNSFNVGIMSDFICLFSWQANIWLAKKRFKFNKFNVTNSHFISF